MEDAIYKWMMTGGTPISGNLHFVSMKPSQCGTPKIAKLVYNLVNRKRFTFTFYMYRNMIILTIIYLVNSMVYVGDNYS